MRRWTIPLSDFISRLETLLLEGNMAEVEKLWERFLISDEHALGILGESSAKPEKPSIVEVAECARDLSLMLYLTNVAVSEITDVVAEQQERIKDLEKIIASELPWAAQRETGRTH